MIVISGALVLVALVLLIFGITTTDLDFVYASIVVSLVSFVFLLIGILQRRGDKGSDTASASTGQAAAEPAPAREEVDAGATAVRPRVRQRVPAGGSARVEEPLGDEVIVDEEVDEAADHEAPGDEELLDEEPIAGTVLVVPGRPRYHVVGCRYLTGKSAAEVEVGDARDEGFSPCGVCKPDDVLAVAEEPEPVEDDEVEEYEVEEYEVEEPAAEAEPDTEEIVLEDVPGASEVEEPVAAPAPARRSRSTASPRKAPAKRSPRPRKGSVAALAAAEPAAEPAAADPRTDPVLEAVASDAPASAPAAPAGGAGAGAARRRTGNVVVIPDRGKFHKSECRYVRNAEGTSTMSRTQAARQGYDACGVCKP